MKTRLAPAIGAEAAARLYRAFVLDTVAWAARADVDRRRVDHAPAGAGAAIRALLGEAAERFELHPQVEGDLGARMRGALEAMCRTGCGRGAIIGTDCPALGPAHVTAAFGELSGPSGADVVLGPTTDGGYYLIALRRPAPELFDGVPWSTADVLDATLARAHAAGLETRLLPRLDDIDTGDDLAGLRELLGRWRTTGHEPYPHHTAAALAGR